MKKGWLAESTSKEESHNLSKEAKAEICYLNPPNEINNFSGTSKVDSKRNFNNILSIKYSPYIWSQRAFNSTNDLSFYIKAASKRRFLPLRAEMLKFLASRPRREKPVCGSPNSDLPMVWKLEKRGKTERGMARPWENSKIKFGKVVR